MHEWLLGIELSLNAKEKLSILTMMAFNNIKIKRENYAKFVGFTIDGNLTWKSHTGVIENKIFKIVGDIYRASHLLDFKHLLKIYFFFIYINYANIE